MHRKLGFAIVLFLLAAALPAAAQPYLQLRAVYLDETHEDGGWLGNDPEIELFQAQATYPSSNLFQANAKATALFNGHLNIGYPYTFSAPDVNDTGKWYYLSTPISIPAIPGAAMILVEDDDYAGHWKGSSSFVNGFLCNPVTDPALPAGITYCQNPSFSGSSDDVFRCMLVVTGAAALGMPETTIDLGEWRVKVAIGY